MNLFLNLDCMDKERGLPSYDDGFFDLLLVDPNYGIGEANGKNKSRSCLANSKDYGNKDWDDLPPSKEYFQHAFRVSKNQIIFGANHFIENMPIQNSSSWIVWDKQNGENDFADCELAWTSFKKSVRIARFKWQGMLQGDMKNKEMRIHPTQKPVALYQWILKKYAQKGNLILDTHVGSASSLIACESLGFNYVGFEKDYEHFTDAVNRKQKGIQKKLSL